MEKVFVTTPVKVGGQVFMPGVHEIDAETADEMLAAGATGVVPDETVTETDVTALSSDEIDRLVAERARVIAETIVGAAVEQAVTSLANERDDAVARAEAAEARLAEIEAAAKTSAEESATTTTAPAAKDPKKAAAAKG